LPVFNDAVRNIISGTAKIHERQTKMKAYPLQSTALQASYSLTIPVAIKTGTRHPSLSDY
jgi:hypothetical protein